MGLQTTKKLGPQIANLKIATFRKVRKSVKFGQSGSFLICDLPNLFADRPP